MASISAFSDAAKDTYWGLKYDNKEKLSIGLAKATGGGFLLAGGLSVSPALTAVGAAFLTGAVVFDNRKELAALPGRVCSWLKD